MLFTMKVNKWHTYIHTMVINKILNTMGFIEGLGYAMVVTNTIIGMYYCVIIAWSIYYFLASITLVLPWEDCNNWWNTHLCFTSDQYKENNISSGSQYCSLSQYANNMDHY